MAEASGDAKAAGQADAGPEKGTFDKRGWAIVVGCILGFIVSLYVFLVGLQMLGDAFKCLGGRGAGSLFTAVSNPLTGLMTGILATVMVQSSSTSTSIVVGLVGADTLSVKAAIPVIMGANIGTSVTNTIVSLGQAGIRVELQRAFSAATVHDMFNLLTVATLLPIEVIIGAIQGEGGPLYWLTKGITESALGGEEAGELFDSPTKAITSPVAKLFISNNKYIINALSLGAPVARKSNLTNASACSRRLDEVSPEPAQLETESDAELRYDEADEEEEADSGARSLLSRRMGGESTDCSQYYCVSKSLDKNFKKISKKGYKKDLTKCKGYVLNDECGEDYKCYLDAGKYWQKNVVDRQIIKAGATQGAGDIGGGIISLIISLILLTGGLFCLVKCLQTLLMGKAKRAIARATRLNDYLAILVGIAITIVVQSSSVTTSALTPLCGVGVITLEKMLPLTLGANIGTTVTALLASLATFTRNAIHIALCHLFFNIFGILIWFPAPIMRKVPLTAARTLGLYASFYRITPVVYIIVTFLVMPAIFLGIAYLFDASVAGGVVVLLLFLAGVVGFEFWWIRLGGCYKVLSQEARKQSEEELAAANAEILGEEVAPQAVDPETQANV